MQVSIKEYGIFKAFNDFMYLCTKTKAHWNAVIMQLRKLICFSKIKILVTETQCMIVKIFHLNSKFLIKNFNFSGQNSVTLNGNSFFSIRIKEYL